jgi:dUTP pyrophosphatase
VYIPSAFDAVRKEYPGNDQMIDMIIKVLECERKKEHLLLLEYTKDEFGEESKKLGLIKYAYPGDAGIDLPTVLLRSDQQHGLTIFPGDRVILHTGMKMAFDDGYWGRIVHRSSTEKRHRLRVIEGTIDKYRGEILVQVHNGNTFPVIIQHGQKLGQLIILPTAVNVPTVVDELPASERGSKGFGSSGA